MKNTRIRHLTLCVGALSVNLFWWGNRTVDRVPSLGDRVQCELKENGMLIVSSAQIAHTCDVFVNAVTFTLGSTDGEHVSYISVDNPRFRTPEGVSVDSTFDQVMAAGGSAPRPEPGWAFFATLPSGWKAAYSSGQTGTERPPAGGSKVQWLFRR